MLPSVTASQYAKEQNAFETVFHRGDIVIECAHSNVSILKEGVYVVMHSKPVFAITHAPGHMFISDVKNCLLKL